MKNYTEENATVPTKPSPEGAGLVHVMVGGWRRRIKRLYKKRDNCKSDLAKVRHQEHIYALKTCIQEAERAFPPTATDQVRSVSGASPTQKGL